MCQLWSSWRGRADGGPVFHVPTRSWMQDPSARPPTAVRQNGYAARRTASRDPNPWLPQQNRRSYQTEAAPRESAASPVLRSIEVRYS